MIFMDQLSTIVKDGPACVNMSLWVHFFAFDCLGEINVSKSFGFLKSGTDVRGMIAAADRILHMAGIVRLYNTWWRIRSLIALMVVCTSTYSSDGTENHQHRVGGEEKQPVADG